MSNFIVMIDLTQQSTAEVEAQIDKLEEMLKGNRRVQKTWACLRCQAAVMAGKLMCAWCLIKSKFFS